jgi:hypothetical protein
VERFEDGGILTPRPEFIPRLDSSASRAGVS